MKKEISEDLGYCFTPYIIETPEEESQTLLTEDDKPLERKRYLKQI